MPLKPWILRALLSTALGLAALLPAAALVPGPILLNEDTLDRLQQTEQQVIMPATRARSACLRVAGQRLCPGMPFDDALKALSDLSASERQRVVLLRSQRQPEQLQAVLAFLPVAVTLPALSLDEDPLPLGRAPQPLAEVLTSWPAALQPLPLADTLPQLAPVLQAQDLSLHYDSQRQLGLVLHESEAGLYVTGAFVLQ